MNVFIKFIYRERFFHKWFLRDFEATTWRFRRLPIVLKSFAFEIFSPDPFEIFFKNNAFPKKIFFDSRLWPKARN